MITNNNIKSFTWNPETNLVTQKFYLYCTYNKEKEKVLREAAKKVHFLVAHLELSGHIFFRIFFQASNFFCKWPGY